MKLIFVFFIQLYEKLFVVRQRTVHGAFAINNPQVVNIIGCIHVVFKIVDSKDAVIKATWMYLRRILRAAWIHPAVYS